MSQGISRPFSIAFKLIILVLLGAYAYGVWQSIFPLYPIALAYAVMSLITFMVYESDKTAALLDARRTSETTLHILELLGGWPGALLAQLVFWHKIKKLSFQFVFWLIVIFHCTIWYTVCNEEVLRRTTDFLPKSVTSLFTNLSLSKCPDLFQFVLKAQAQFAPPAPVVEPEPPPVKAAEPSLEEIWASDPVTETLILEPGTRRAQVIPPKENRRLTAEIKAVSPFHGLLVALPPNIRADGVIAPSTLVDDFHRRFQAGETITVAIKGIKMKGTRKQMDLLLVEP